MNLRWIVDDLPDGLDFSEIDAWLPPRKNFRTVITTRSREYDSLGSILDVNVLGEQESLDLLLDREEGDPIPQWACQLVAELGYFALAIDVARSVIKSYAGLLTPEEFVASLSDPDEDALELASELSESLPNGYESSIAKTLLAGIQKLPDDSLVLLQIAAMAADAPIPVDWIRDIVGKEADKPRRTNLLVAKAIKRLDDLAWALHTESGELKVHSLLTRSMRYHLGSKDQSELRSTMQETLLRYVDAASDPRRHRKVGPYVPHAQVLASLHDETGLRLVEGAGLYFDAIWDYQSATDALRLAHNIASELYGADDWKTVSIENRFGLAASSNDDAEAALDAFDHYERVARRNGPRYASDVVIALGNKASALAKIDRVEEALEIEREVLNWRMQNLPPDDPLILVSQHQTVVWMVRLGQFDDETVALERDVWMRRKKFLGEDHPHTLSSLQLLASIEGQRGNSSEASKLAQENVRLKIATLGKDHPNVHAAIRIALGAGAWTLKELRELDLDLRALRKSATHEIYLQNYGLFLWQAGYYEEAIEQFELVLEKSRDQETIAITKHNLMVVQIDRGAYDYGEKHFPLLRKQQDEVYGAGNAIPFSSEYFWSLNPENRGDAKETLKRLREVEARMSDAIPESHPYRVRCRRELWLRELIATPDPLWLEHLISLSPKVAGQSFPDQLVFQAVLGAAYCELGRFDAAMPILKSSFETLRDLWRPGHPDVFRCRWYLCHAMYASSEHGWKKHWDVIAKVTSRPQDELTRTQRFVKQRMTKNPRLD